MQFEEENQIGKIVCMGIGQVGKRNRESSPMKVVGKKGGQRDQEEGRDTGFHLQKKKKKKS